MVVGRCVSSLLVASGVLLAAGCGGSAGGGADPAPGVNDVALTAVLATPLPSVSLPSAVLPSVALPSQALPSRALPSRETSLPSDAIRTFEIDLDGDQTVPAVSTVAAGASATAQLQLEAATQQLEGSVVVAGLAETDWVTGVQLRTAPAGLVGETVVEFLLEDGSLDSYAIPAGGAVLSPVAADALLRAETYLVVETSNAPSGLLRGQVVPEPFQALQIELESSQVIPVEGTAALAGASGVAFFTFDATNGLGSGAMPAGAGPNDGNPAANNPIVVARTSFDAAQVEVVVGGGFPGLNSAAANPVRIVLNENVDGVFVANAPGTPDESLQSIAALGGVLNGVYHLRASDADGGQVRGQILPAGLQSIRIELEPEQVIPTDTTSALPAGDGGVAFFTFDETNTLGSGASPAGLGGNDGNPAANNPVVVARTTFDADRVEVIVGGGFPGLNSAATNPVRIVLVDPDGDGVFVANGPGTPDAELQSIAGLGGVLGGVYHLAATDAQGGQVRGQILPRGLQSVRIGLEPEQVIAIDGVTTALDGESGAAFFTFEEANTLGSGAMPSGAGANDGNPLANNPVVVARTSFDADRVEVIVGGGFPGLNSVAANPVRIVLSDNGAGAFVANGPGTLESNLQSIAALGGVLSGVYHIAASDAAGGQVRGQVLPRGLQSVRIGLEPEQVVVVDGVTTALDGESGVAFFTFEETNTIGSGAMPAGAGANDGNPMANNPVVVARTSFDAARVEVVVGGGFPGLNSVAANPVRIVLSGNGAGAFVANGPGTPAAELQSIAALGGVLNGVYHIAAVDADGGQVRGQILPRGLQSIRIGLEPEQVVPVAGATSARLGESGVAFLTFDETNAIGSGAMPAGQGPNDGNPLANNPVVVARTSFDAERVDVVVGGGFAGLNSPAANPVRIALTDPDGDGVFIANGPGTPMVALQSVAALGGLQNGVYHIAAVDVDGGQVRGQILPAGTQALRGDLVTEDGEAIGAAFLTVIRGTSVVATAAGLDGVDLESAFTTLGSTLPGDIPGLTETVSIDVETLSSGVQTVDGLEDLLLGGAVTSVTGVLAEG